MRVLIINGFGVDDTHQGLVNAAVETLAERGHEITRLDLHAESFGTAMSVEERAAYHEENNLVTDEVIRSADLVRQADGLLFCYPTITHTVPAIVKGWCERVLIPGVAFVFDDKGRVAPGMTNIVRLGAITVSPHGRRVRLRHGDLGRRIVVRSLRLSCNRRCRRTFLRLRQNDDTTAHLKALHRSLASW